MKIKVSQLKKLIREEVKNIKNISEAERYTKDTSKLNPSEQPAPELKPGDVIASDDEGELIYVG